MNEQIKTFSLVVITVCVFIMTVIEILNTIEAKKQRAAALVKSPTTASQHADEVDPVAEQIANQPKTTVKFEELKFDFGDLKEGDEVKHKFSFTNTGSNPLIISSANGSCGCTIPSYSKEPIPPGGKGEIEVQFNSKGKDGLQNKTVTVAANTDPQQTVLHVSANVRKEK